MRIGDQTYEVFLLPKLVQAGFSNVGRLPFSLKVLLENLLRFEDGVSVEKQDIEALARWEPHADPSLEIAFRPGRE